MTCSDRVRQDSRVWVSPTIVGTVPLGAQPVQIGLQARGLAPLWTDATWVGSESTTVYARDGVTIIGYEREARILIGPADDDGFLAPSIGVLPAGSYQVLYRLQDSPERPVEKAYTLYVEDIGIEGTAVMPTPEWYAVVEELGEQVEAATDAVAAESTARAAADAVITGAQTATAANTQRFLSKLYAAEEDAAMLIISDSTAATTTRWAYLSTLALADLHPAYTVVYHLWDPTGEAAYDTGTAGTPTTIQTGTSAHTLHIWNFSVSGKSTSYGLAGRFPLAIAAVTPDLVVVAHGKNEQTPGGSGAVAFNQAMWAGRMLSLTEAVTAAHPYAGLVIMQQCPNSFDPYMQQRAKVYNQIAALRGYGIINVLDAFMATGHPYDFVRVDGVHPTDASDPAAPDPEPGQTTPARDGAALWTQVFMEAMRYDPTAAFGVGGQQPSAFTQEASQQLPNGSFAAFTGSVPDSWTATGATTSKDVRSGWFEGSNGYGVRIQATGASASYIRQQVADVTLFQGKWVTLRVRMKQASAATTSTSARISLADGVSTALTTESKPTAVDGFFDQIVSLKVATTASYLRVTVYADSASNAAADVTVARVDMVLGVLPKIGSQGVPGPAGTPGTPGAPGAGVKAIKPADETRTNNTITNDSDLLVAVTANTDYLIECHMYYSAATNVPDFKAQLIVPAGATLLFAELGAGSASTSSTASMSTRALPDATNSIAGTIGATSMAWRARGILRVGAAAGNLQVMWAQNVTDANGTTLLANSWLLASVMP